MELDSRSLVNQGGNEGEIMSGTTSATSNLDLIEFDTESPEALSRRRLEYLASFVFFPLVFGSLTAATRLLPDDGTFPGMSLRDVALFGSAAGIFIALLEPFAAIIQPHGKWRIDSEAFDWIKPGGDQLRIRWSEVEAVRLEGLKIRSMAGVFRLRLPLYFGDEARKAQSAVRRRLIDLAGLRDRAVDEPFRWINVLRAILLALALGIPFLVYLRWTIWLMDVGLRDPSGKSLSGIEAGLLLFLPILGAYACLFWRIRWRFQWHETKPNSEDRRVAQGSPQ